MSKFVRNEDAFTGLEAAIVLIAFVVVAAVFSYVVLGAGFFTTQKSQEVVHTSVSQTSSSMEVVGDVIGYGSGAGTAARLNSVDITLGLSAGGGSVDFNKLMITYSDKNTQPVKITKTEDTTVNSDGLVFLPAKPVAQGGCLKSDAANDGEWHIRRISNAATGDEGVLLEPREMFTISVGLPAGLKVNEKFTIEIQPSVGSTIGITRTVPPQIDTVNKLF